MAAAESTSNTQMVTPLPSRFPVAFSAQTIELRYWLFVQPAAEHLLKSGKNMGNIAIFTNSLSALQALNSADPDQMIQGLHSTLAKLTAQSSVFLQWVPASGTDRKRKSRQTCKDRQSGSADTGSCHLQRGQDTSPLPVQWRLEERKRWVPGTP